jgi:hypothetical protein
MAIQTVYYRQKIDGTGWRYRPLAMGRWPQAARNGPYFIRVRNSAGKYQWVKQEPGVMPSIVEGEEPVN